jgi:hypothetical protein
MSKLSWCHGIRNHATVQGLLVILRNHGLRLVFLSVTIKKSEHVCRLQNHFGLRGFGGVDSDGMSRSLDLFCHESIHVDDKELNERLLICMFGWLRVNQYFMWHSSMGNLARRTVISCGLTYALRVLSSLSWVV